MSLYVTVNEFKQAPTGIDTSTLDQTNIGVQAAQDAALLNVLRRASAWVDNICNMNTLEATTTTETKEVRVSRDGRLTVHVDNVPIISVTSVGYRTSPDLGFTIVDPNNVQAYSNWFTVYFINTGYFAPSLAVQFPEFGYQSPFMLQRLMDMPLTVQYTYVNGYFNALTNGSATAGSTTLNVTTTTGLSQGSTFTIYDGQYQETCTVQSINGNTITLSSPLLFNHASGVSASAIPAEVKQATILLAGVLIRERGSVALTMGETAVQGVNSEFVKTSDVDVAKSILRRYIRVAPS